jgi:hypothetical protein
MSVAASASPAPPCYSDEVFSDVAAAILHAVKTSQLKGAEKEVVRLPLSLQKKVLEIIRDPAMQLTDKHDALVNAHCKYKSLAILQAKEGKRLLISFIIATIEFKHYNLTHQLAEFLPEYDKIMLNLYLELSKKGFEANLYPLHLEVQMGPKSSSHFETSIEGQHRLALLTTLGRKTYDQLIEDRKNYCAKYFQSSMQPTPSLSAAAPAPHAQPLAPQTPAIASAAPVSARPASSGGQETASNVPSSGRSAAATPFVAVSESPTGSLSLQGQFSFHSRTSSAGSRSAPLLMSVANQLNSSTVAHTPTSVKPPLEQRSAPASPRRQPNTLAGFPSTPQTTAAHYASAPALLKQAMSPTAAGSAGTALFFPPLSPIQPAGGSPAATKASPSAGSLQGHVQTPHMLASNSSAQPLAAQFSSPPVLALDPFNVESALALATQGFGEIQGFWGEYVNSSLSAANVVFATVKAEAPKVWTDKVIPSVKQALAALPDTQKALSNIEQWTTATQATLDQLRERAKQLQQADEIYANNQRIAQLGNMMHQAAGCAQVLPLVANLALPSIDEDDAKGED